MPVLDADEIVGLATPVEPVDVERLIRSESIAQGVDPEHMVRMARAESSLKQSAVSPKGAIGIMQLMPDTARTLGVDPHDTVQNVQGGVRYYKQLLDQFGGDRVLATAAYNAGPERVERGNGFPKETSDYVNRIIPGGGTIGEDEITGLAGPQKTIGEDEITGLAPPEKPQAVPGLEKLGGVPPAAGRPPQIESEQQRAERIFAPTPENVPEQYVVPKTAGANIGASPLDIPALGGAVTAGRGVTQVATAKTLPQAAGGVAEVLEGAMQAAMPSFVSGVFKYPVQTAISLGGGIGAQQGIESVMQAYGKQHPDSWVADPDYQRLVGDVFLAIGGAAAIRGAYRLDKAAGDAAERMRIKQDLQDKVNEEYARRADAAKPKQITGTVEPLPEAEVIPNEPAAPTPKTAAPSEGMPQAKDLVVGARFKSPIETQGEYSIADIDKTGKLIISQTLPDGTILPNKIVPRRVFQGMLVPPTAEDEVKQAPETKLTEPEAKPTTPAPPETEVIQPQPTAAVAPEAAGAPNDLSAKVDTFKIPDYVKDTIKQDLGIAHQLGVIGEIEDLSAKRMTAAEIAKELGLPGEHLPDKTRIVRSVRAALGVPSMDDKTAFEKWIAEKQTPGITTAPEAILSEPEATSAVDVGNQGVQQQPVVRPPEGNLGGGLPVPVPAGNGPEPIAGLPQPGAGQPAISQPEPPAGNQGIDLTGPPIRRVTGSADIPLNADGVAQAQDLAKKATQPFDWVLSGPGQRTIETARAFSPEPTAVDEFAGWSRGQFEGRPAAEVKDEMARLMTNADERPPGVSPISGKPGQSYNEFLRPLLSEVQQLRGALRPDERALIVTSGGNLQAIDAWAKAGFPEDFKFDRSKIAKQGYWTVKGEMFRLTPKGLEIVLNNAKPGDLYFVEHGATAYNPVTAPDTKTPEAGNRPQPIKAESANKPEAIAEPHQYASTQVNLPSDLAGKVRAASQLIPDSELTENGRESEPHITVLYGLHGQDPAAVAKVLEGEGPITAKVKTMSIFPAKESGNADVVKLDIDSPDLRRLNAKIAKALPFTNDHPVYQPHITVAYLRPGEGSKYAGRSVPGLSGQTVTFNSITFSPKEGPKTDIPLTPTPAEQVKAAPEAKLTEPSPPAPLAPAVETPTMEADNEPAVAAGQPAEPVRATGGEPLAEQLPQGGGPPGESGPVAPSGGASRRVRKPRAGAGAGQGTELEPSGRTVSGAVGNPAEPERTFPPRATDVVSTHLDRDYRIPDGRVVSGSPEARARINIEAIKTLREILAQNRPATVEEQRILANYVGWGAVPQLFAGSTPEFQALQNELRGLLSDEEYDDAQRSTTNAHYTGDMVVDAMWKGLQSLGAKPGMSWLEPAVGVGNFFGRQPAEMLEGARRVGLDKEPIAGNIAKLLYPDSGVDVVAFEDAELPKDYFDGAISNVPFGNFGVHDPEFRGKGFLTGSIHNYFFAKALTVVRPGGVVAFVTSRYTMDAYAPAAVNLRKWIGEQAHLIGAVRLPSGTFRQNAGTDVITDVIFLRKKLPEEKQLGAAWEKSEPKNIKAQYGTYPISVNEYYHAHPENILGQEQIARGQFTSTDYDVKGAATPEQIQQAIERFEKIGFEPWSPGKRARTMAVREIKGAEGSKLGGLFFDDKGNLLRRTSKGAATPVEASGAAKVRIRGQLAIRDALSKLLAAELADKPEPELNHLRKNLNSVYDGYTRNNGPLSSQANIALMKGDPDAPLLVSLERKFQKGNKSKGISAAVEKAPIFSRRMLNPPKVPTSVGEPKEALYISLNETGRIDWDRMTQLTGRTPEELQKDLAGLIYLDPTTKSWQTAEEYLSGSVRKKLKEARALAKIEPRYQANADALERVQPEDIPPGQIRALLGVTWVPLDTYGQFASEMLGAQQPIQVKYVAGNWIVDRGFGNPLSNANKWGTARVGALELLDDSLNMRRTKVLDRDSDGSTSVNPEETKAARARQMEMQDHFEKWLFADPKRGDMLVRLYNDTQNDLRLRTYEGAHLTLPGMARDAAVVRGGDLDPHQKAAVWRQIVQPNVLLAHAVGAGKTFEAIAGGMELKRLGLIRRPMYVVPNSTLTSWQHQFSALYPQARVLVFSEKDLEKSARQRVMAQIATGDWDAVVVPHSSFQFLATGDEIFNEHYDKLSKELEEQLSEAAEAGLDTRQIKRMEKAKERLLTSLKDKRAADRADQTVTWEQLGIDHLVVDESHEYKKLGFATKQGNVAGIDQNGNQKTFDLLMKLRYTQKHGRGAVFMTGTPVTNTMGELYSLMKYLIEPELEARGIGKFDEWATNFGRTVDVFEPKVEGGGYQMKARFAQFVNIPELAQLLRSFADVVTSDMIDLPRPSIVGGRRQAVETQLTPEQEDFLGELRERAKDIRQDPRGSLPDNMLAVYTDAAKMAMDIRMVRPGAPDDPRGRLNMAADKIAQLYNESAPVKGTQLVMSDLGKPAEAGGRGFSAYDELIDKLVERGIPRDEIAHIYQAKNKSQRTRLFQDVNDGKIRVLLGSTQKMGVGVNVQQRLYAMHHLDVPHRPSDLEQREGRILRQGNENPEVHILYYVTRGSLDEAKFANVVRKAKFINQVMQGKSEVREAEDVGGMVPSLEMFQAMASGDPRVMQKMETDAEVDRLSGVFSGWRNQQYKIRSDLAQIPGRIQRFQSRIDAINRDIATRDASAGWTVGKAKFSGEKISKDVSEALTKEVRKVANSKGEDVQIGTVRGLPITATYNSAGKFVRVEIGDTMQFTVTDEEMERGVDFYRRVQNQLDSLEGDRSNNEKLIERTEKEGQNLQSSIEEVWPYAEKYQELVAKQQRLVKELGADKGDDAAIAAGEGAEISDKSVEAEEPEADEEDGQPPEEESEEEPAKVASAAIEAGLTPLGARRTPQVRSVWEGNGAESGQIVTDGHMAIDKSAIDPAKTEALAKRGKNRAYPEATVQSFYDKAVNGATKPLIPVGWKHIGEGKGSFDSMFYADADGKLYAINTDYAKLIQSVTGATEVKGSEADGPVAFYKDGRPVAIAAQQRVPEQHRPSESLIKRFLREESGGIPYPRSAPESLKVAAAEPKLQELGAKTQAANVLQSALDEESDKNFGEKLRTFVTGERDVRIAETNQLREELRKLVPDPVQQEALSIMRDFKSKPGELQQFVNGTHPAYKDLDPDQKKEAVDRVLRLMPAIEAAENPTPEMLGADAALTNYFERHLAEGRKLGFLDSTISNEEYITHLLQPQEFDESPSRFLGRMRGKLGPRRFKFANQRFYPTLLDAVVDGVRVRSLNALDALGVYGDRYASTAAYHLLLKALSKTGAGKWGSYGDQKAGKIPRDWVELSPESRLFRNEVPFTDEKGEAHVYNQTLFVPPKLAKAMKPILDANWFAQQDWYRALKTWQSSIKLIQLGLSFFHLKALNVTGLGNEGLTGLVGTYMSDMNSDEFLDAEKTWVRAGMTTPILGHSFEIYKALNPTSLPSTVEKIRSLPGIKQIDKVAGAITHLTFGIVQRKLKVTDASLKYAAWVEGHPQSTPEEQFEARRLIAKEVNAAYGGLNWENLGVNKNSLEIMRAIMLAPDWTYSNVLNLKYAAADGGPGGNAARLFWARSIIFGLALSAGLSILLSGQRSKDPTRVRLGKDKNGKDLDDNMFFVGAPGDLSTWVHDVIRFGAVIGTARLIGNKLGPFARAGVHLVSNTDAFGRPVIPKTSKTDLLGRPTATHKPGFAEKTELGGLQLVRDVMPIPFSVSTVASMLTDPKHRYTPGQYAEAVVSGRKPQVVATGTR